LICGVVLALRSSLSGEMSGSTKGVSDGSLAPVEAVDWASQFVRFAGGTQDKVLP
jgi:hypothetical protein